MQSLRSHARQLAGTRTQLCAWEESGNRAQQVIVFSDVCRHYFRNIVFPQWGRPR